MSEAQAMAKLEESREKFLAYLNNHWSRGGTREVRGIPARKRAKVAKILAGLTVRLRDW
jgi:hypothetical protein